MLAVESDDKVGANSDGKGKSDDKVGAKSHGKGKYDDKVGAQSAGSGKSTTRSKPKVPAVASPRAPAAVVSGKIHSLFHFRMSQRSQGVHENGHEYLISSFHPGQMTRVSGFGSGPGCWASTAPMMSCLPRSHEAHVRTWLQASLRSTCWMGEKVLLARLLTQGSGMPIASCCARWCLVKSSLSPFRLKSREGPTRSD